MTQNETTRQQSKELLALGLAAESADNFHNGRWFRELSVPAWSLAALLNLIPNYQLQTQDDNKFGILYGCKEEIKIIEGDSPFEVVYKMVCWLLENNYIEKKL